MARILVVDDDGFSRNLLAEMLRALGQEPTVAADAREGLQMMASKAHDGVITDVRMPGWDGIELARRIGMLPDAPPVVLMSADSDFDIHEEALRRGVRPASFLQKPFDRVGVARILRLMNDGEVTAPTGASRPEVPTVPLAKDDHPDWLTGARGPASQLSPARIWFVAWRRQASGAVIVRGRQATTIGFKRGQIADVAGVPGLLASRLPNVNTDNLTIAVGSAMAMGISLDEALGGVALDVARWSLDCRSGDVRWDPAWAAGPGAIPLPGTPPRLLTEVIADVPEETLMKTWQAVANSRVTARNPTDVPSDRWGLDPQALRAQRLASGQAVQALIYELSGGVAARRVQALRALDLLFRLNLVTLAA